MSAGPAPMASAVSVNVRRCCQISMLKSEMAVLETQRASRRVDDFQDLVASTPAEVVLNVGTAEGREKKRRVKSKVGNVECSREKRMKAMIEEAEEQESKQISKLDYVHVRARRGQATDSHSLAERARREKISERMKHLQNLVPGCDKIAGKAGMLDEIINYVQSLQQQVEFLSLKLATLNPTLDFVNVDHLLQKQVFPTIEISPEMANSSSYFHHLGISSSSVTVPETPLNNSASITHFELSSAWGNDLQSLYSMRFEEGGPPLLSPSSFLSQQYSSIEDENGTFVDDKDVPF